MVAKDLPHQDHVVVFSYLLSAPNLEKKSGKSNIEYFYVVGNRMLCFLTKSHWPSITIMTITRQRNVDFCVEGRKIKRFHKRRPS